MTTPTVHLDETPTKRPTLRQPSRWSMPRQRQMLLGVAVLLIVSLMIDFGLFHFCHHSDSVIPVLVSLQRWTPYYWGQDRFGMLLPLLAMPFRHPVANLVVQCGLNIFAMLLAFLLTCRFMMGKRHYVSAALLAVLFFVMLASGMTHNRSLSAEQPCGPSMALGVAGLLTLHCQRRQRGRWARLAGGFTLLALAFWVNTAVVAPLVALTFFRWSRLGMRILFWRNTTPWQRLGRYGTAVWRKCWRQGILLCMCMGLTMLGTRAAQTIYGGGFPTIRGLMPLNMMGTALERFAKLTLARDMVMLRTMALLMAVSLSLAVVCWWRRRSVMRIILPAVGMMLAGAMNLLIVGATRHVWENTSEPRYALPAVILLLCGGAALTMESLRIILLPRAYACLAPLLALALMGATIHRYGTPSPSNPRYAIDYALHHWTPDLMEAKADFLIGQYWAVWIMGYHADIVRYEQGMEPLWVLCARSEATEPLWRPRLTKDAIIACRTEDLKVIDLPRPDYLPPLKKIGTSGRLTLFKIDDQAPTPATTPKSTIPH